MHRGERGDWPGDPLLAAREVVRRQAVTAYLQPVADLVSGAVIGYEALARGPADSPVHAAPDLFAAAARAGVAAELEDLCRRRALEAKRRHLAPGQLVFVNLDFPGPCGAGHGWLAEADIPRHEVVLEISERVDASQGCLRFKVADYRALGCRVALDDVGAGRWALATLAETMQDLSPQFLKLDRRLLEGLEGDAARRRQVAELARLCRERRVCLVAEGIDTAARLSLLRDLGVPYGQGFFLGLPGPTPAGIAPEAALALRG